MSWYPSDVRPSLLMAALSVVAPSAVPAAAWAFAARFGDVVAVRGRDVEVRIEILDDPGVVERVVVELRAPGDAWTLAEAARESARGSWWIARFSAPEVWGSAPASRLEARAVAFGPRGGSVIELGTDEPLVIDVLTPREAERRAQALQRARPRPSEDEPDASTALSATVGAQGQLFDRARIRGLLGIGVPLSPILAWLARVSVGPAFATPERIEGGTFGLGIETGLRIQGGRPASGAWTPFVGPRAGAELRLPGVDGLIGVEAGAELGLGDAAALELALIGGVLLLRLDRGPVEVAFTGGLRVGVRLGGGAA